MIKHTTPGKIYKKDVNVYQAAIKRINIVFDTFDGVYLSVSGGKDSSVMCQLVSQVAKERGRKFDILFIDLEAQYTATIDHMHELISLPNVGKVFWVCLPISLRNAVSNIQPKWICWDKKNKYRWVRDMPDFAFNEDSPEFGWFQHGSEFEDFIINFAAWYIKGYDYKNVAAGIGIRSNESLNRFRTIVTDKKIMYKDYRWTTKIKYKQDFIDVYNFYPIYDWCTEDIWHAVSKFDLLFNPIYELMYKNGMSIHEQRLCQPYGDDQREGLDQFKVLEPETWEKVLYRVEGVNFGNIYARSSLLGNIKSEKPFSMTWQQYSVWLLETIGLYSPELRDHYYRKIKKFAQYWKKDANVDIEDYPDEANKDLESRHKIASWRRIARAIERNDFWMKRLSFGQTKSDVEKLISLREKYANFIDPENTTDKHLKGFCKSLDKGL